MILWEWLFPGLRMSEINNHLFNTVENNDNNEYLLNSFECYSSPYSWDNAYKMCIYDKFIMICKNGLAFKINNFENINLKPSIFKLIILNYMCFINFHRKPIIIKTNKSDLVLLLTNEDYSYIKRYLKERNYGAYI